jgi:Tfp pilus assembly protein PilN
MDAPSPKMTFFTLLFPTLFRWIGMTWVILIIWSVFLNALIGLQREKNIQRYLLVSEKLSDIQQYEQRQGKMMASQARLDFIATLRRQNEQAAFILKELVRTTPQSIHFSFIRWRDKMVQVKGFAYSEPEFTAFINTIGKSSYLKHPVFTSGLDKNGSRYFELKMELNA